MVQYKNQKISQPSSKDEGKQSVKLYSLEAPRLCCMALNPKNFITCYCYNINEN